MHSLNESWNPCALGSIKIAMQKDCRRQSFCVNEAEGCEGGNLLRFIFHKDNSPKRQEYLPIGQES